MKIDIAICTWNRAELLSDTLQSIRRVTIPEGITTRIVVINNNSTDNTIERVRAFEEQLAEDANINHRLSVVLQTEPQQGHTFSRNRAIGVADGDLMLWTDDDVIVDSNWLNSYVRASANQDEAFWGGKIIPKFIPEKPAWIEENWDVLKGCFAERDLGLEPAELKPEQLPYGANFAIRTSVQKKFLYNVELGRREDHVLGEDEIEMFQRLLAAGYRGSWVPESSLFHIIGQNRANEAYVRDYFIGQGKALIVKDNAWSTDPKKLWWQMVYEFAAYRFKRHWAKSPAWAAHLIRSGLAEGQYLAAKSQSR